LETEVKKQFSFGWEYNIKMNPIKIGCALNLSPDENHGQVLNAVMNTRVCLKEGNLWLKKVKRSRVGFFRHWSM
jgi:hypothetical protein